MKFLWTDDFTHHRCDFAQPVTVKLRMDVNSEPELTTIKNAGFIIKRANYWIASTYGSCNPDSSPEKFINLYDAKRYVEEQALLGVTLNKLTR